MSDLDSVRLLFLIDKWSATAAWDHLLRVDENANDHRDAATRLSMRRFAPGATPQEKEVLLKRAGEIREFAADFVDHVKACKTELAEIETAIAGYFPGLVEKLPCYDVGLPPEQAKAMRGLAGLVRAATKSRTPDKPKRKKRGTNPNDHRDKWLLGEYNKPEKPVKEIVRELAAKCELTTWAPITTREGIYMAIKRYCKRKGLVPPPKRNG